MRGTEPKNALGWIAATIVGGAVAVAALNATIDPFAALGTPSIARVNAIKLDPEQGGGRVYHALGLRRTEADTLLLGSSRVRRGLDPNSAFLGDRRAYKVGLPGANFAELRGVALYALAHRDLRTLVIGLDFYAFSTQPPRTADGPSSGFAGRSAAAMYLQRLVSIDALGASLRTLAANLRGVAPPAPPHRTIGGSHGRYDHRARFTDILRTQFFVDPGTYAGFTYGPERFRDLEELLGECAAADVEVRLFFSPIHARQLEAIRAVDLFASFEQWKRDVRSAVEAARHHHPGLDVALWDFSSYGPVTTEAIPPTSAGREMAGYWESSHYKSAVGDRVLAILFGAAPDGGFGFAIAPGTSDAGLEAHLERDRLARVRYAAAFPDEVADVLALARATAPTRAILAGTPP